MRTLVCTVTLVVMTWVVTPVAALVTAVDVLDDLLDEAVVGWEWSWAADDDDDLVDEAVDDAIEDVAVVAADVVDALLVDADEVVLATVGFGARRAASRLLTPVPVAVILPGLLWTTGRAPEYKGGPGIGYAPPLRANKSNLMPGSSALNMPCTGRPAGLSVPLDWMARL